MDHKDVMGMAIMFLVVVAAVLAANRIEKKLTTV